MFGGGGGVNPRKLQQMMEQMGIEMNEIDAVDVEIRTESGEVLYFDTPEVTRMDAQGQRTFQIVGEPETREGESSTDAGGADIPDEDVELVAERTGESQDAAREALEATDGDLAEAIARLS